MSWKKKLRDRFEFLRRGPARPDDNAELPDKQPRIDESYEENVKLLQGEMEKRKKNRNIATIQSLTERTYTERRRWMKTQQPLVEIVEKFPSLKLR